MKILISFIKHEIFKRKRKIVGPTALVTEEDYRKILEDNFPEISLLFIKEIRYIQTINISIYLEGVWGFHPTNIVAEILDVISERKSVSPPVNHKIYIHLGNSTWNKKETIIREL